VALSRAFLPPSLTSYIPDSFFEFPHDSLPVNAALYIGNAGLWKTWARLLER